MNRMLMRALGLAAAIGPLAILATAAGAQFRGGGYRYQTGRDLYTHICQGCHMPDGKGAAGAGIYPALAGNVKLQSPLYPVLVVLKGQKAMPSFSELTDAQIVEVTGYIRSQFGNNFPGSATPEQVKALRTQAVRQNALRPG